MKCHYEVLQVETDACEDDIRKAYRKLALKWHPDKNLENSEEAKQQFQLIQQAYEVLSDPQERSWYDRHKDSILKGGYGSDYEDDSLNVYQYFNTTCFKGYGDDINGFYAVYSEVFNKIGAEDREFDTNVDSDFEIPIFGDSKSSYEDIVYPFYSYWQSYSTKKPYSWLDEYDIRGAPNRRILRLMEKENKKLRDKARKERNEEVRALVAFVRKRDKRVQEYALYLERKAIENEKKVQEFRKKQIIKKKEEMSSYVECDWAKFSNLEGELKEIEANLAAEFDDDSDSESEVSNAEEDVIMPHCLACKKVFKTAKALTNHEKSKKHKENLDYLKSIMQHEDALRYGFETKEEPSLSGNQQISDGQAQNVFDSDEEHIPKPRKKKKSKKSKLSITENYDSDESAYNEALPGLNVGEIGIDDMPRKANKIVKNKADCKKNQKTSTGIENKQETSAQPNNSSVKHKCVVCSDLFSSKNELFKHLKSTGHAVPLSENVKSESTRSSKQKKKKK